MNQSLSFHSILSVSSNKIHIDLLTNYLNADLLDEEIETLRALIESYDNKITILEDKNSSSAPSSVNAKGKRVKAEEV